MGGVPTEDTSCSSRTSGVRLASTVQRLLVGWRIAFKTFAAVPTPGPRSATSAGQSWWTSTASTGRSSEPKSTCRPSSTCRERLQVRRIAILAELGAEQIADLAERRVCLHGVEDRLHHVLLVIAERGAHRRERAI